MINVSLHLMTIAAFSRTEGAKSPHLLNCTMFSKGTCTRGIFNDNLKTFYVEAITVRFEVPMSCITQYFLLCIEHFTPSKCTIIVEHPTHVEILMSVTKTL